MFLNSVWQKQPGAEGRGTERAQTVAPSLQVL